MVHSFLLHKLNWPYCGKNVSLSHLGVLTDSPHRVASLPIFQENVESKMFRSLFPRTPLIGAFCGGEIGVNFLPNQPDSIDDQLERAENPKKQRLVIGNAEYMQQY